MTNLTPEVFICKTALENLQNYMQQLTINSLKGITIGAIIPNFLSNETKELWDLMDTAIKEFLYIYSYKYNGLRVIVSTVDGITAYDSASSNNSYDNFINNSININQNTNPHNMNALISNEGTGYLYKFNANKNKYTAFHSLRIGPPTWPIGCSTVSYFTDNSNL